MTLLGLIALITYIIFTARWQKIALKYLDYLTTKDEDPEEMKEEEKKAA